jgi:hypothetical protein
MEVEEKLTGNPEGKAFLKSSFSIYVLIYWFDFD